MIDQILQIAIVGTAAAAENLHAELAVQPQHVLTPVVKVVPVQDLGAIKLTMVE